MEEIDADDSRAQRAKQRKKQKKLKARLQKLADRQGCTISEYEMEQKCLEEQYRLDE